MKLLQGTEVSVGLLAGVRRAVEVWRGNMDHAEGCKEFLSLAGRHRVEVLSFRESLCRGSVGCFCVCVRVC